MRDVIFRGKRIDNGEWVEGSMIKLTPSRYAITDEYPNINNRFIAPSDNCKKADIRFHEVDPKTIGEFTGLLDHNQKMIFEGDKLFTKEILSFCREKDDEKFAVVEWNNNEARFYGNMRTTCYSFVADKFSICEIIGNIHDNPELVKKEILEEIK